MPKLTPYQKLVAKAAITAATKSFKGYSALSVDTVRACMPRGSRTPSARQLMRVAELLGWELELAEGAYERRRGGIFGRGCYYTRHAYCEPTITTESIRAWVDARKAAIKAAEENAQ